MVEFVDYEGYGKCVELSADGQRMLITCDVGPRIIYYAIDGSENILYEDRQDLINKGGDFFDKNFHKGEMWHIYGGHRLWRSPEDLASYYPDNYPIDVEILDNGAVFTAKPEIETTGLQKIIKITYEDGIFTVEHKFVNKSSKPTKCSLWALTVLDKGGIAYYPYTTEDTGLLPNRNLVMWAYTDIRDKRIKIVNEGVILRQDKKAKSALKLGFLNQTGEHYYLRGDTLFSVIVDKAKKDGAYPDWSCSTETYTNEIMLELETISELKELKPEESAVHTEKWRLFGKDTDVFKAIKNKIKS